MNVPWLVGSRYFGARGDDVYLSFISKVSLIGLVLGVVALTVVVSVMNGFDRELKYRILGAAPHVVVETTDPESLTAWVAGEDRVLGYAGFLRRSGVIMRGQANKLVSIYGIEPEHEADVSILPRHVIAGSLDDIEPGTNRVIVGRPLAFQLGLVEGDTLTVIVPEPSPSGNSVVPRIARVAVAGFFELDSELDYGLIVMHRSDLALVIRGSRPTFRLTLENIFLAPSVAAELRTLSGVTAVSTWTEDYGDFFETVRMEKIMMFILLTLIVAIAAFNIVSGLAMMVRDKQADIAVFRTMGLSQAKVMQTFMIQGSMIGVAGTLIGLVIGIPLAFSISEVIAFFENLFGARMLAGTYFEQVPSDLRLLDLLAIAAVSLAISLAATLYPAYRASRLHPASVLRYE